MQSFSLDDALARVDGDRELLVELASILRPEAERMLADIRTGLEHDDAARVEAAAHALRGSVASLGARAAAEAARLLELAARSGELSEASGLCDRVEREVRQLLDELGALPEARCES